MEDLYVEGMKRGKNLGLSVGDAGLGEFRRQATYKGEWYGARLIVADRFFHSTQLCSDCGVLNPQVKGFAGLKVRVYKCPACGLTLGRDENAARNLRAYGLRQLQLPEGLREVTPAERAALAATEVLAATKTALAEAGSDSTPSAESGLRDSHRHPETGAGAGYGWDQLSHLKSRTPAELRRRSA